MAEASVQISEAPEKASSNRARGVSFAWEDGDDVASLVELKSEAAPFVGCESPTNRTAAGISTIASRMCYAEPSQTMLFYDFDDTLFPTTDIFDRWGISSKTERWDSMAFTEEQKQELEPWRRVLFEYLATACSLSDRVVILTNSRRPWVTDCVRHFAPNLLPLFEEQSGTIRVVYAREHIKATRACNPQLYNNEDSHISQEEHDEFQTKAKFYAMRKEVRDFYSQYPGQTWKNIISIGDAPYEHDAVQEVTFQRNSPPRERLRTKAIQSGSAPTISAMTVGFQVGLSLLPAIVHFNGDLDINFSKTQTASDRMAMLAEALNIPELATLGIEEQKFGRFTPSDRFPSIENEALADVVDKTAIILHDAMFD